MHNNKRRKVVLVAIIVFSMIVMYGFMPAVKAASMDSAKDTLSDSAPEAVATHTVVFDLSQGDLSENQYVQVSFQSGEFDTSNMAATCPDEDTTTNAATSTDTVTCTVLAGQTLASTSQTITITGVGNPDTEGDYDVTISAHQQGGTEIESSGIKVYVINAVTISATVPATLTFGVAAVNPASSTNQINGVAVTATSTATSLPFGTLEVGQRATVGHHLTVTTNADSGYAVTVEQDGELSNGAGATINSFDNSADGSGSTTPHAWAAPLAHLDDDWTYGHMGLMSDDADLFSGEQYIGFNGTAMATIMSHSGPADGTTQSIGSARVAYSVQISALQEAGDYDSTITYICTPTY